jgi:hypothetical protein
VAGCGGGMAELGRSWRKVMTGGAHLFTRHGEGQRRHEVRRFPVREWESGRLGKEKGSGPRLGQKPKLGPVQVIKLF